MLQNFMKSFMCTKINKSEKGLNNVITFPKIHTSLNVIMYLKNKINNNNIELNVFYD